MSNSELFDSYVPSRFQKAILRLVFSTTKSASAHVFGEFNSYAVAIDALGNWRRQKIEDQFAGMKALFSSVKVSPRRYEQNTGSYHEITSGKVKLTQSCVASPNDVPREAKFRVTLATNGQHEMFRSADPPPEDAYLYSILTYGIDLKSEKRSIPSFVRIQFPNADCTKYVDEGIDLFKRFPEIVAEFIPKPQFGSKVKEKRRKQQKPA